MSSIGKAIGKVVGGITGAGQAAEGAQDAAQIQAGTSQAAIDEQKRQFDEIVKLLSPFVSAGTGALSNYQSLLGLKSGNDQQRALNNIQQSPVFQALIEQGEQGILQNASATGGLRGGNVQAALAQFRPNFLNQQIQQRLAGLSGLISTGQASAAQQAVSGQQSASNIGSLLQQQGAALAGGQLAQSGVARQSFSDLLQIGGAIFGGAGGGGASTYKGAFGF